jgi:arylsulfatase A-like enzyme
MKKLLFVVWGGIFIFAAAAVTFKPTLTQTHQILKKCLLALFLIVCTTQTTTTLVAQSVSPSPNIIVILADDLGYGDVSYNHANPEFLTPNIDSLAINGVQFTNGYVTHPFCTPTRAALITGRYQQRFGIENLINEEDATNSMLGLPLTELTLAQLLKPAGYTCGLIGKWHLGTAPTLSPNQRGFDYFYGFLGGQNNYWNAKVLQNGTSVSTIKATPTTGYTLSAWTGSGTGSYTGSVNPSSITIGGPITEMAAFTHN